MPFSIVMNGYPQHALPVAQAQGPALQGMLLHLLEQVDPAVSARLHNDNRYRPYTLSPLGIGERGRGFSGFRLPRERELRAGMPCYARVTFLEDGLFPTFSRFFLSAPNPTLRLGRTEFVVTEVLATPDSGNVWSSYVSYEQLIARNVERRDRQIALRFVTPTSFRARDVDLPLPVPRLVFQSYVKRLQEFYPMEFLPDFVELVEQHTGIARIARFRTDTITTNKTVLNGFVGEVTFVIGKAAPAELASQMHLLADFAFFCGTGKKTTVGMGQTTTGIEYKPG